MTTSSFLMVLLMAIAVYVAYAKVSPGPDDPFGGLLDHLDDPDEAPSVS